MRYIMTIPKNINIKLKEPKYYYLTVCPNCNSVLEFDSGESVFGPYDYVYKEKRFLGLFKYMKKEYFTHCSECGSRIYKRNCRSYKSELDRTKAIYKLESRYK